ncbi:hypothetical protein IH601_11955 [Candidatus Bipolaricaulota bacterium]|jgi:hypothetical protein|nr:hypothetical protein [Candidatus Bipolaricaulota bacterium]
MKQILPKAPFDLVGKDFPRSDSVARVTGYAERISGLDVARIEPRYTSFDGYVRYGYE